MKCTRILLKYVRTCSESLAGTKWIAAQVPSKLCFPPPPVKLPWGGLPTQGVHVAHNLTIMKLHTVRHSVLVFLCVEDFKKKFIRVSVSFLGCSALIIFWLTPRTC